MFNACMYFFKDDLDLVSNLMGVGQASIGVFEELHEGNTTVYCKSCKVFVSRNVGVPIGDHRKTAHCKANLWIFYKCVP